MDLLNKKILIIGGTGFLGKYILQRLAKEKADITIASRNAESHLELKTAGSLGQVKLENLNIENRVELERLVSENEVIINCVGILYERKRNQFAQYHTKFPELLGGICKEHKIRSLIHISALGVDKVCNSKYSSSKHKGEEAILDQFPEAVILRPSVVFGTEDNFFNKFAQMASISPFLPLIAGGTTRFQPIYVADLAEAIFRILDRDIKSEIYELGGADILTFKEILEFILRTINKQRILLPLPLSITSFIASFTEIFAPQILTKDQVSLLKNDNVTQEKSKTLYHLDIQPKSHEDIVPKYLAKYQNHCYHNQEN
jgi:uncharacterized protein YbjT (DUF2867 family)